MGEEPLISVPSSWIIKIFLAVPANKTAMVWPTKYANDQTRG